jgi:hypothetical protein
MDLPHAYPPHNGSLLELTGTDPAIVCGQHCQRRKSPSAILLERERIKRQPSQTAACAIMRGPPKLEPR